MLTAPGSLTTILRERAGLLGHDLGSPHRAIVVDLRAQDQPMSDIALQRAASNVFARTSVLSPRPLVAVYRRQLVALWPEEPSPKAPGEALYQLVTSTSGVHDVTVAVSAVTSAPFGGAYQTTRGAVALARASGRIGVVTLEELGVAGLLLQLPDPTPLRHFATRTLGPLAAHDAQRGGELLKTLRTYLDSGFDRQATARALVVHANTVSQRLRRIHSLSGLDLGSPQAAMDARVAITLADVAEALSS
ncbi:PucR family transcriptional regulator [Arthrobacter sp. SD76]|uniref:PucR family transcriptional regulator n=1 Tax=Arthrobacter sp. SD76 TaxID=3415007 RepID=UPI003C7075C2